METLLITGGSGFVGSNLAVRFKKEHPKIRVIALDNLKRRGSELNLPRLKEYGVEFIHGDIRNREDLEAVGPFDCLIECSAEPSVLAGYNSSPECVVSTNLVGTVHCLEMVRRYKADIVFLSTSRVYPIGPLNDVRIMECETRFEVAKEQTFPGISTEGVSEQFPLEGFRSLYGATKLGSELLIQEYIHMYGIRAIINRCSVISGPWQMGKVDQGVVVLWVARHLWGGDLDYIGYGGSGKQVRDVLSEDDLFRLLVRQVEAFDELNGQVFNVGGGRGFSLSLRELTELCCEVTGKRISIGRIQVTRPADIPYYVSDCQRVRELTGWEPTRSPREIIQDVAAWLVANEKALKPIIA